MLTQGQKEKIPKALRNKEALMLRLSRSNLKNGNDVLNLKQG